MNNIAFPIKFTFKITSLANDFRAIDAHGNMIAYVRQKMFKFKENIQIFGDEQKTQLNYEIQANKWLDFSAAYGFTDKNGRHLGKVARKGWSSLWRANYEIIDQFENPQYSIREENGWVKVLDGLLGQIPILNILTGYFLNPSYKVMDKNETIIARIKKDASFWGRHFTVDKLKEFDKDDGERIMLSLMMMILLERNRG